MSWKFIAIFYDKGTVVSICICATETRGKNKLTIVGREEKLFTYFIWHKTRDGNMEHDSNQFRGGKLLSWTNPTREISLAWTHSTSKQFHPISISVCFKFHLELLFKGNGLWTLWLRLRDRTLMASHGFLLLRSFRSISARSLMKLLRRTTFWWQEFSEKFSSFKLLTAL